MTAQLRTLAAFALTLAVAVPAAALSEAGYSVEILVNGRPLAEHAARGTTYVEALENAEYSVRIRNHTGRRVAVALAIDGLNSIDAKTTSARGASKWVVGPWQTITVDGWQTGVDSARRFFFTSETRSYGAWLGQTANLGVIEAVVFREAMPEPPRPITSGRFKGADSRRAPSAGSSQAAPESGKAQEDGCARQELADDLAATGIGRELDNPVRRVELRTEREPAAHLRLRYEYRPQLVRLGVLPDPASELGRREQARGFAGFDFAPDPWK